MKFYSKIHMIHEMNFIINANWLTYGVEDLF